jgi:hypothetical protein
MKNERPTEPLSINQSTLIAAAGEYYVLARLSLCGKIAAQAPRGAPNADIVVTSVSGDRLCAVQVKARQGKGADGGWHMSKKHETIKAPGLFYAFVDFGSIIDPKPVTYIVPSDIVTVVIRTMHAAWLAKPGQKGQQRNDSDFRRFMPDYTRNCGDGAKPYVAGWLDRYRDAWSLLP